MTELKLTPGAASVLFGHRQTALFEGGAFRRYRPLVRMIGATLVLGTRDGRLYLPDENPSDASLPFRGVPANLCLVAGGRGFRAVLDALAGAYAKTGMHTPPPVHRLGPWPFAWVGLSLAVLRAQAAAVRSASERMGDLTRQVVFLREQSEQRALQVELARRMLAGAGYDRYFPVFEAAADGESVGPGHDVDCLSFSQILPTDLAGTGRILLPVFASAGLAADGRLAVRIVRTADEACLASCDIPFGSVDGTPVKLDLMPADPLAYGDLRLEINWQVPEKPAPGSIPYVRFAAAHANRFGTDGRTLGHSVFRRLGEQGRDIQPPVSATHQSFRRITPVRFAEVMDSIVIPGGREAMVATHAKTGIMAVRYFEDAGFVQLHPMLDQPAAIAFTALCPSGWSQISARIANASAGAPCYRFVLARVPHGTGGDPACIARIAAAVADEADLPNIAWTASDLKGGEAGRITLTARAQADDIPGDIVFMTLPVEQNVAYGWCRWHSLDIETVPDAQPA